MSEPDLTRFIKSLRAAEPTQNADPLTPYVRQVIFEPLLLEQDLRMKSIDFSAFDMEDLRAVIDYAEDRSELADKLERLNDVFCRKSPAKSAMRAFC